LDLLLQIKQRAKKLNKNIVLPETNDDRILKAADIILKEKLAQITLLGNKQEIIKFSQKMDLENIEEAIFVDPFDSKNKEKYGNLIFELRKHKGLIMEEAIKLAENPLYLAATLVKNGDADGVVAGAAHSTGRVLHPALQIIKAKQGINVVSGAFIMFFEDKRVGDNGILVFADCAVRPTPTSEELAQIAICSAETAKNIAGLDPRVALLSFSTKGSVQNEAMCDKVIKALEIAKSLNPDLKIDGELQADAALNEFAARRKSAFDESSVAGRANVLVFPTLEAGNIAYKLVQYLTKARAIGPILQGLSAPMNDLSRACTVDDIIDMVAVTGIQAMNNE